jgi:hypothetical protein
LAAGILLYAAPPLSAIVISLLIFRARPIPDPEASSVGHLLRRTVLPEAGFALICGLPVIGMALESQNSSALIAGFALGIPAGVSLLVLAMRRGGEGARVLEGGGLRGRVMEFARSAAVRIDAVSILSNWKPSEANAFAWLPAHRIFISDSLLGALTKREADAVLAHEVGHSAMCYGPFLPSCASRSRWSTWRAICSFQRTPYGRNPVLPWWDSGSSSFQRGSCGIASSAPTNGPLT